MAVEAVAKLVAEPDVVSPLDQWRRYSQTSGEKSAALSSVSSRHQYCQVGIQVPTTLMRIMSTSTLVVDRDGPTGN